MAGYIKDALELALNSTFPMRSPVGSNWMYAGNFIFNDKTYAFIGDIGNGVVTVRCVNTPDYANHWFNMKIEYDDNNKRVIFLSSMDAVHLPF